MKALYLLSLTCILIACNSEPIPTIPTGPSNKSLVIASFNTYKKAVDSQNGQAATQQLSSSSIRYYDQVLDHVLYSDKEKITRLSSGDMMQILGLRLFFPKEQLLQYNGAQLFQAMVDNKFTARKQLAKTTIGKVAVKGNNAKGQMVLEGKASPIFFDFRKEEGVWKLDMTTTVIMTTKHVDQQAKAVQLSVPAFLETAMQLTEEEKNTIWQPL
ncbi:MAG: hypothetical protein ACRBFS_02290 [Aureispira sp.]